MTNTKSWFKNIMIAFLIISLAVYFVNGIVTIRDALVNSGLLAGTVTSTYVKPVTINQIKTNLTRMGLVNTTDQKVLIQDTGKQYIITVLKRKPVVMTVEGKQVLNYDWEVKDTLVYPKQQEVTITSTYDFTSFVQVMAAIIGIGLLIVVAEKLGIKL